MTQSRASQQPACTAPVVFETNETGEVEKELVVLGLVASASFRPGVRAIRSTLRLASAAAAERRRVCKERG